MPRPICGLLALSLLFLACQAPPPPEQDAVPEPTTALEGAWHMVAIQDVSATGDTTDVPVYENLILFAGHHYSIAFSRGDHRSEYWAERWNATDDELLDRFHLITVNTGTYELTDATLVTHPMFALVPEFVGGTAEYGVVLTGDQLTLNSSSVVSVDGVQNPQIAEGGYRIHRLERIE